MKSAGIFANYHGSSRFFISPPLSLRSILPIGMERRDGLEKLARSRTRGGVYSTLGPESSGKEARKASQRWLMPVTNTIQGSHLRDTRNPIRGFDLHKPTLDRVTRGHLTSCSLTCTPRGQQRWPLLLRRDIRHYASDHGPQRRGSSSMPFF